MPYKPRRQCPGRGSHRGNCSNTVASSESYCATCAEYAMREHRRNSRQYDRDRDQCVQRQFLHSTTWRKMRAMKLAKDPLCEICLLHNRDTIAVLVHHIDCNELNNNNNNHLSLCNECHEKLHKKNRWKTKETNETK